MRKFILTEVLLLFFVSWLWAQDPVSFGLKGGANFSTLTGHTITDADHRTGLHAGALAHIHVSSKWAVQPEVMYSVQGAEYASGRKDRFRYLNVPVLGQYMFGRGFRVQSGPQLGFLLDADAQAGHSESNVQNGYKKTDVSWTLGTGYLTGSGLGFDVRYNIGLTDVSRNNTDVKNRVWQVGLFYQF